VKWNLEYLEHVKTFIQLHEQGQETPLDTFPELDDLEEWVYSTFNRLKRMSRIDDYIAVSDYKSYFEVYPSPINVYTLLDILMIIDHEVLVFKQKLSSRKPEKINQ